MNSVLPSLYPFTSIFARFLPESVRWQISSGRYDKAEKTLATMAKSNKKTLPSPLFTEQFKEQRVRLETVSAALRIRGRPLLLLIVHSCGGRLVIQTLWWSVCGMIVNECGCVCDRVSGRATAHKTDNQRGRQSTNQQHSRSIAHKTTGNWSHNPYHFKTEGPKK